MSYSAYIRQRVIERSAMDNPAFRQWFAGSKIVDTQGRPLVVYHGTKADIDGFDIKKSGTSDEGLVGRGFYFTYNPSEASGYALNDMFGKGNAPNVIPAYVCVKNPLVITHGVLPDGRKVTDLHRGGINAKQGNAIRNMAEHAGHDGIVFTSRDGELRHVVAFRPEQIKSVFAQRFDPASPRLSEDLNHGRRLLFHATSWNAASFILATDCIHNHTTDTAKIVSGSGVSLTRSYAYALAHAKGPRASKVVFVIDATRLRTTPVNYWAHDPSKPDEAEEFHQGPIENLHSVLVSVNSPYMDFATFMEKLKKSFSEMTRQQRRDYYRSALRPVERYIAANGGNDAALWNRWQPVRGIS